MKISPGVLKFGPLSGKEAPDRHQQFDDGLKLRLEPDPDPSEGLAKPAQEVMQRLRLDRSTALYIYKAKNCKLLAVFTDAQKTKFIFK